MKKVTIACALCVAWFAFALPAAASDGKLETLATWLSGSFSSERQSDEDSAYYDIRLEMVPIWIDRTDAAWLYIEQALATRKESPYRQRVYRVTQIEDDLFKSEVYALPDPEAHRGDYKKKEPLAGLAPDDLLTREGCAVFLRFDGSGEASGGTIGRGCGSDLRGASYATSEVIVTADRIESWDRGFAETGDQVWGAEKGAYIFLRR